MPPRVPSTVSRFPALDALEKLDRLLAGREPHVGFLPILALPQEAPHPLPLSFAIGHPNIGDLDAEERGHSARDLDLVGTPGDLEADGSRRLLEAGRLFRDQRASDDLLRLHHFPPRVSTTRPRAWRERTTVPWFITS